MVSPPNSWSNHAMTIKKKKTQILKHTWEKSEENVA